MQDFVRTVPGFDALPPPAPNRARGKPRMAEAQAIRAAPPPSHPTPKGPFTQCLRRLAKGRTDVASAVQHAHDVNAIIDRRVEDDVPPEREAV